ncbi:alpha/beta hydrolase [Antrihabitans sp. YC2-6]|uniref:alpha/beta hydrolase n=1 Tax=Antrihabitans sp. YC2-6 TaxID=2799498 RepID=UPI0035A984EA
MRRSSRMPTLLRGFVALSVALVVAVAGSGTAAADPIISSGALLQNATSPNGSYVDSVEIVNDRTLVIYVYSASMMRPIPVQVQRPANTSVPQPTLYLLNGAGGGVDNAQWRLKTDALQFLSDKPVNVVSPVGGPWSYYTDWKRADPVLGLNKWKTFLTQELPPIIDAGLGTNGVNAIAGLSSSGTSVLQLAESAQGLYKAVASYSGCAQTSDPIGQQFITLTVETWGGGDVENMYGAPNDPAWVENDPYVHADKLRGLALYISTGNGLPGQYDVLDNPYALPGPTGLANQIVIGGVIEAGTNFCTRNLQNRLNQLGIPATYNFRPAGTHSWGYWQDDFKASWPVLAGGLGI